MMPWLSTTYIVFILPLKLNDSFIPTYLYSDMWYNTSDSYMHRSTLKKIIGNCSKIIGGLMYPLCLAVR